MRPVVVRLSQPRWAHRPRPWLRRLPRALERSPRDLRPGRRARLPLSLREKKATSTKGKSPRDLLLHGEGASFESPQSLGEVQSVVESAQCLEGVEQSQHSAHKAELETSGQSEDVSAASASMSSESARAAPSKPTRPPPRAVPQSDLAASNDTDRKASTEASVRE